MILTRVVIKDRARDFRLVTNRPFEKTLRQVAQIVRTITSNRAYPDVPFAIAERIFAALPHYPVCTDDLYRKGLVEWYIFVDCKTETIDVGKPADRGFDTYIRFGEDVSKLRPEGT